MISGAVGGLLNQTIINSLNAIYFEKIGWKAKFRKEIGDLKCYKAIYDYAEEIGVNLKSIDPSNLQEPSYRLVSSYLEASANCIGEKELQKLFAKIVANTADASKTKYLHPSFGNVLNQLSSLDAKLLRELLSNGEYGIILWINNTHTHYFLPGCHQWFGASWEELDNSLRNLDRLGLISIVNPTSGYVITPEESEFFSNPRIQKNIREMLSQMDYEYIEAQAHPITITSFGFNLLRACS